MMPAAGGAEQAEASAEVETISEGELRRICDEIYRDRFEIYDFNPGATRRAAVLWMLLGCLISLLSVRDEELQAPIEASSNDPYADAVCELLRRRAAPGFDPVPVVEELAKKVESE